MTDTRSVWNILDFGAVGDGETKNSAAFAKAIDAASRAGGGTTS
jgi:polygalacturonase